MNHPTHPQEENIQEQYEYDRTLFVLITHAQGAINEEEMRDTRVELFRHFKERISQERAAERKEVVKLIRETSGSYESPLGKVYRVADSTLDIAQADLPEELLEALSPKDL